jgi:hypothetical protein
MKKKSWLFGSETLIAGPMLYNSTQNKPSTSINCHLL